MLCRFLSVSAGTGFRLLALYGGGGGGGMLLGASSCISVSVSLTSSWLGEPGRSSDFLLAPAAFLASSSSFAIWISRANQLMPYQRPAQRPESTTKWMLEVAMRRIRRRSWSAPKEALVAMRRVGVGPGVKMDSQRSTRKLAMVAGLAGDSESDATSRRRGLLR